MKIKVINKKYEEVKNLPSIKRKKPIKQSFILSTLVRLISIPTFLSTRLKVEKVNMNKLNKKESYLALMNHSSFTDLKIIFKLLYPRRFNIVASEDAFVGQEGLLRHLGCFATKKFTTDPSLVRDMIYIAKKFKNPIVMYPEAGYTYDGTSTTLPDSLGKLIKLLKIPVVFIKTTGAFLRDPLYNNLQIRKVKIHTKMECLLSKEEVEKLSVDEINNIVYKQFTFDELKYQQENKIEINEPFRADKLNRILYRCSSCGSEGFMEGKGITLTCHKCGKVHELTPHGYLKALDGKETITHIPTWYQYERECVRKEIESGKYKIESDVEVYLIKNYKAVYKVEDAHLTHTKDGFHLKGINSSLDYHQNPLFSYCINSDFNWYEIGDVVCIGEKELYYLVPKGNKDIVCKIRLAVEEMYKIHKEKNR